MKEQIRFSNETMKQWSNVGAILTPRPFHPTLGGEGDIFAMDAGMPTEGSPRPSTPTVETKSTAQLLQETGINNIQNSAQLTAFVSEFQEESRQAPSKNPFKDWSIDRLKKQYLAWHVNTSKIENQQKTFGEKEAISGHAHPYSSALIEELERRQVDIRELFLESTKRATEAGASIRSIGAATRNLTDYEDPVLQNIIRENNAEVDRIQRAQGRIGQEVVLEPEFIRNQTQRVRDLLDQGRVDANEANRLLGDLNSFMAEYMAAARAEAEEAGGRGYYNPREETEIMANANGQRERIFEELFVGVDARPGEQFREALSLDQMGRADRFFTVLSRASDDPRETNRLTQEFSARFAIRKILHDVNWSVSGGGDIQAFANAVSTYPAEYTDLIFSDPLVQTALHMFEQAFQKIKADNSGMLPYEKLAWNFKTKSSGLEDMVWDQLGKALTSGSVKEKVTDEHGEVVRDEHGRPQMRSIASDIPEWRLRRAITLARGFGVLSLRFPEIAAEARLPEEKPGIKAETRAQRFASIYGESISKYLDPLEHSIEKFTIGGPERALLYFFLTGEKGQFESTKQIREALEMKSHLEGRDKRLIDIINIFRTGGPFSYSSWRAFTAMKGMPEDQLRRSGIGMREARVSGDVDDVILEEVKGEVRVDPAWRNKSEEEITEEAGRRVNRVVENKESKKHKEDLIAKRRLAMWKDALKVNPLRVMWMLESREAGQRIRFLSEALGIPEDEAKQYLDEVEKNLMIVQEEFVSSGRSIEDEGEMLNFDIINDVDQRERVSRYVAKIREKGKGSENDYRLVRQLFEKTPAEGSPFPFIIGMEDVPFLDFDFINTGGRAFARRIEDLSGAIRASNELIGLITKFPTTHDISPIIDSLVKIKDGIMYYDRGLAMEILPYLEEGILRIYDKDFLARLPLGIGTFVGLTGDTSYAQKVLGRSAMSWDETDKYNFTKQLLDNGLIEKEKLGDLRKRTGATVFHAGVDFIRTYGEFLLFLMAVEFAARTAKGK